MVLNEFSIDDVNHSVYINPLIAKKSNYFNLCGVLLRNIDAEDYIRITTDCKNNRKMMLFKDLVDCFERFRELEYPVTTDCICGKKHITRNFSIINKKSNIELIVGSTCGANWFPELECNKLENGCEYCGRNNKKGGNCKNCIGKMSLKSVFSAWKSNAMDKKDERERMEAWKKYASDKKDERERIEGIERERIETMELNEKVSFGKYKHLTYKQLCIDNVRYVKWCLDESGIKDSIKDRLRYFYNKYSIQQNIQ
jgi:hypothetical protein